MKNQNLLLFATMVLVGGFLLSGCYNQQTVPELNGEKINVMVSVLPQMTFVEEIGGNKVEVYEMIPPGFSPATYEPSPSQLKKLQDADLYFRIGHIPFEKAQMEKLKNINPDMQVVDTSEGIVLLKVTGHTHDDEGDDPHIWLSPELVKIQATHIYDTLVDYTPKNKNYFFENYNRFLKKLEALDQKLKDVFAPMKGKMILVFHPAFGYLANDYGFVQKAIEIEGKDPSPKQLEDILNMAKKEGAKVIFVQKQFSTKSAQAIAEEIDGAVVQIDPLAEDYFTNLEDMANVIVKTIE